MIDAVEKMSRSLEHYKPFCRLSNSLKRYYLVVVYDLLWVPILRFVVESYANAVAPGNQFCRRFHCLDPFFRLFLFLHS